jgi:16S rRNA (uracil1498-N3)-methyltransferase
MADKLEARLFVPDALAAGAELMLTRSQTHYLAHVLRLAPGAAVALFNGRDGEWRGRIGSLAKNGAILALEAQQREQPSGPDLWLMFAPVKRAPLDVLVQKATELGVSELIPVITRRTIVERVRRERMEAIVIESAEQCERLTVPRIRDAAPLSRILDGWPNGRRILLCAEAGPATPIREVLGGSDPVGPCAVLTGPEGGFDQTELDALRKLPFVTPIGLGPRILRADTAALAALACWQAVLGDWQERPPGRI